MVIPIDAGGLMGAPPSSLGWHFKWLKGAVITMIIASVMRLLLAILTLDGMVLISMGTTSLLLATWFGILLFSGDRHIGPLYRRLSTSILCTSLQCCCSRLGVDMAALMPFAILTLVSVVFGIFFNNTLALLRDVIPFVRMLPSLVQKRPYEGVALSLSYLSLVLAFIGQAMGAAFAWHAFSLARDTAPQGYTTLPGGQQPARAPNQQSMTSSWRPQAKAGFVPFSGQGNVLGKS
mmetsp:Transcript_64564/g.154250  ORF Transcript_64564/g.154250 Transcript_64564/m.154250 type:complete len:235 (-) Transcript_64564:253-957(-)